MNNFIIVKAKLNILTIENGGCRKTGIVSGYRPDHVFEHYESDTLIAYMGDITFTDWKLIYPGEEKIVTVRFLNREAIKKYIYIGRKWLINEGPKLVANAEILELL